MTQMDLLHELDQDQTVLDATVLGWYLQTSTLAKVVAAIDDEQARADFEHWFGHFTYGRYHGERAAKVEPSGIRVLEWPRQQPWLITWDRMWTAVRANLTPTAGAAFLALVAAREAHEADRPSSYRMDSYPARARDLDNAIRAAARAILGDSGGVW